MCYRQRDPDPWKGKSMNTPLERALKKSERARTQVLRADRAVYMAAQQQAVAKFAECLSVIQDAGALWSDLSTKNTEESETVRVSLDVVEQVKAMSTQSQDGNGRDMPNSIGKEFGKPYLLVHDRMANPVSVKLEVRAGF